jgi:aminoglycoside phosphotransferase (APT) family kinase protein
LDPPAVDRVGAWLEANRPTDQHQGVVHGDFHLGNVLLSDSTAGVTAIVDWELATVGDPMLDLGQLLVTWPDAEGRSDLGTVASVWPPDGLATEDEMIEAYGASSDRDLSAVGWYKVLAAFRLAVIIEGTWARACAGIANPVTGRSLHGAAISLLSRAAREMAA